MSLEKIKEDTQNVSLKDIPKAVFIHESIGLSVMLSLWYFSYKASISKYILNNTKLGKQVKNRYNTHYQTKQQSSIVDILNNILSKLPAHRRPLAINIGVAYAESFLLRKLLSPVLIPLKLWITYKIVMPSEDE
eukprot:TRINITY_DN11194_c0_g1_i1.p1 TRINITY_DN11194_c0_g1~~TRINITY_DN11194_c0_g1_i1.p1  ORF type:complete len:134 (-),score=10.97 TRINITY_DN11194_c0_g1_i1:7-408(-)